MNDYTQDIKNIQITLSKLYEDMASMERGRTHVLRGAASYLNLALDELDSYVKVIDREKNDIQPIKQTR